MTLYFRIAYRNLKRHWRQSLAAILSITAAFIALVFFEGYIEDARRLMISQFRHRMMYGDVNVEIQDVASPEARSEPWKYRITPEAQKFLKTYIEASSSVEAWSSFLRVSGMASNGDVSTIFAAVGYDLSSAQNLRTGSWYVNTLYGRPLEEAKEASVVLAQTLGAALGCFPDPPRILLRTLHGYPPGERPFKCGPGRIQFTSATPSGQVSAVELGVVGLMDAGFKDQDSKFAFIPLDQAQSLANTKDLSYVSILLKDPSQTDAFAKALNEAAKEKGLPLIARDWREHKAIGDIYRRTTGLLNIFRNFVIVVILCISTLSVLNTLIKIVKERTREIGTWRSLGYNNRNLLSIFASEAIVLGFVGCFFGVLLSVAMSTAINSAHLFYRAGLFVEPVPFTIAIVPGDYFISIGILTSVCLIASFVATRNVLSKNISENLTYA